MSRGLAVLAMTALTAWTAGCAAPEAGRLVQTSAAGLPRQAMLVGVPYFSQDDDQCGPAALAMAMVDAGRAVAPEELRQRVFVPARAGSFTAEMLAAPRRFGLLAVRTEPTVEGVLRELGQGTPVVVFQNLSLPVWPIWHYAVAIGYDLDTQQIVLHSGAQERLVMSLHAFERTWARGGRWAMTVTPPQRLPAAAARADVTRAAAALERSDAPAALLSYEAMLARWPDDRVALFGRGNALYAGGRKEEAVRAWRATVSVHPDFADAWNNLAQALLDLGRRDEARAAVVRALALGGAHLRAYEDTRSAIDAAR